jgi:hypothetical protein
MSVLDYLNFLADAPRVEAFRRAIERAASPGQVVLDLGTGIGTYAMFAAQAGARVLAVEAEPVVEIARELAVDNGLADRITFLKGRLQDLEPPERAHVLVFEDYSPSLFHEETARLLDDVRERWLEPSARAIPRYLRASLAPVCCPETYGSIARWNGDQAYGLDISRFSGQMLNDLHHASWGSDVLLAEPVEIGRADPLSTEAFGLDAAASWQVGRDCELHGLGLWIDLELADGVTFSNGPSGRSTGWDQVLLPLGEPVQVRAGETVEARVMTLGPAPREPKWWSWRVRAGGAEQEMNTFRGLPLSLSRLRQASLDHRPALGPRGQVRRATLDLMDGRHTVAEIARELMERFPQFLSSESEAYRALARELEAEEGTAAARERDTTAKVR